MTEFDYEDLAEKFLTRREATLLIQQAGVNLERALAAHQAVHGSESAARDKAESDVNRRLEDMNQFRAQLRDQAATFVTRDLFDSTVATLDKDVTVEREARTRAEGALATWRAIAGFLGISGIIGTLLGLFAVFGPA